MSFRLVRQVGAVSSLLAAGLIWNAAARGEILPSFSLDHAARYAVHVVVVEEGKVVETWKGDLKPGTPLKHVATARPIAVDYYHSGGDRKLIDAELAHRKLTKVPAVSGRRLVHF